MARVEIVAVKDTVTGEYLSPMYVHNPEEASRLFKYQLETNKMWGSNKEQFQMYALGFLDTETGNIFGLNENEEGEVATLHPDLLFKGQDILD